MHVIAFVLLGLSLYVSLSRAFEEQGVATLHKNRDAGFEAEQGQPAKLHREQKEQLMQLSQYDWQRSDSTNGRTLRSEAERAVAASDVAVVNDIPAHFEVLASVLVVLNQLGVYPEVYYTGNNQVLNSTGFLDWVGADAGFWHATRDMAVFDGLEKVADSKASRGRPVIGLLPPRARLLICVSAELAPKVCSRVVSLVQPSLLMIIVHRADTATPTHRILRLQPTHNSTTGSSSSTFGGSGSDSAQLQSVGGGGALRLLALAPHVAALASTRLRVPVAWAMLTAPRLPSQGCSPEPACYQGFSLQGSVRPFRSLKARGFTRNYTALWSRLLALKDSSAAARDLPPGALRVVVVGKGARAALGIPPALEDQVSFHPWLPYPEFWSQIASTRALVPAFGMPVYYESRISSTITASLITLTPLLAEQKLLDTYTFLGPQHVFLRLPGEDEAAAMMRVAALPAQDVAERRAALAVLRSRLNMQAAELLRGYMRHAGAAAGGSG